MSERPPRKRADRIFSVAILERQLRAVLIRGKGGRKIVVRLKNMKSNAGWADIKDPWDKGPHTFTLNENWVGRVPGVIHELVHLHLRAKLKPWGVFEEPFIEDVLEREVREYIASDPKRSEWWEGAVALKLEEGE